MEKKSSKSEVVVLTEADLGAIHGGDMADAIYNGAIGWAVGKVMDPVADGYVQIGKDTLNNPTPQGPPDWHPPMTTPTAPK